jgi:hypothetical protein
MSGLEEHRLSRDIIVRYSVACAVAALVIAYVVSLTMGWTPKDGRIDFATIVLVLIAALSIVVLVNPQAQHSITDVFGRLRSLQVANMRFELAEIRAQQTDQTAKLEILGLLLPLVITKAERKHLVNLYRRNTKNYNGNSNVRSELRRLRYLTLINNPRGPIGSIPDAAVFDLEEVVELTPLGRLWARRIEELPKDVELSEQAATSDLAQDDSEGLAAKRIHA